MLAARGVPVLTLEMGKGRPDPLGLWQLTALLRQLKPSLLQTYLYHADLLGLLAGKLAGVPRVFWNIRQSNMDFSRYRRTTGLTVKLCARLSRYVDQILVNSHAGLEHHAGLGYDRDKMVVIPNGFDGDRFRPDPASYADVRRELGLPGQTRLVGMAARFDPQKDHETFFQAAALANRCYPDAPFLVAGHGLERNNPPVRRLLEKSGLDPNRVFLMGERSDMPRVMASLDVFVSSSAFGEGFPNVIGEAMACGVPCAATDVGDAALIVGQTGIIVPPREPGQLAQGILQLLNLEPEAYRAMSAAARQRLLEKYGLARTVSHLESLYAEALENPGAFVSISHRLMKGGFHQDFT
jgi:glycosyltransferase involved in cell wall biosynthesis